MINSVIINTSCRIHINSLDMNGFNKRCCGGVGFYLNDPKIVLKVSINEKNESDGHEEVVNRFLRQIQETYKLGRYYKVEFIKDVESHIGLGSETQIKFALAAAVLKLENINESVSEFAHKLHLSGVSGIGYGGFAEGGFVMDLGYIFGKDKQNFVQHSQRPPTILKTIHFPDDWKVVLINPKNVISIDGEEEDKFFKKYTPVPVDEVKDIVYHTFMGIVPAIKEKEFDMFIENLKIVSSLGTKRAELLINRKNSDCILKKMNEIFGFGGLSSLGPTCYTFFDSNVNVYTVEEIKSMFPNCNVSITSVRNSPHELTEINCNEIL